MIVRPALPIRRRSFPIRPILTFSPVAALLLLAACQPAAEIQFAEGNASYATRPITQFTFYLRPDSAPQDTFKVTLNGTDITNRFSPAATPGATVNATAPANFEQGKQTLTATATAKDLRTSFPASTDTVEFYTPVVTVTPAPSVTNTNLSHKAGQMITAFAVLSSPMPAPITVTLTSAPTSLVSLDGAAVGAPVNVVVPITDRKVTFTIKDVQAGANFTTHASATGFATGQSGGQIQYT